MKIGIIREGKTPPDSRVPLTPRQCRQLIDNQGVNLVVQPSPGRCFSDEDYKNAGVPLQEDLSDCAVLLGVKEVPKDLLIPNKTYFFFSHTIKAQPYNRDLLRTILRKQIRLIDYEMLTDDRGKRLIAFGRFAGMVGAHNAWWTYGKRTGQLDLPRMCDLYDYAAAKKVYADTKFPPIKIVLTGSGRVGKGAAEVLDDMGIKKVSPQDFISDSFDEPVYTQLEVEDYAAHKDGVPFDRKDFYENPTNYESIFTPYTEVADVMINGIYWDNNAPAFFSKSEMRQDYFKIKVIADVTCDIAPVSSIPSTLYATTIADPVFGYDPVKEAAVAPFAEDVIDMMTIDNLPNEMPRDASQSFGNQFIKKILPELLNKKSDILDRATIAKSGALTQTYSYLSDYVAD